MKDKILFIAPVLNEENRILKLIDSVQTQTSNNWMLIIVDNASTDLTKEQIIPFATLDQRIVLVSMEERENNIRLAWSRAINTALQNYRASHVQIIPGDDYLVNSDYVEKILENFKGVDIPGILPCFQYINFILEFTHVSLLDFFRKWEYVHLVFGAYEYSYFERQFRKFERTKQKGKNFDWYLSYFLASSRILPSSEFMIFRDSGNPESFKFEKIKITSIIYGIILNFLQNFRQFVAIGYGFAFRDRLRLLLGFVIITTIDSAKILIKLINRLLRH